MFFQSIHIVLATEIQTRSPYHTTVRAQRICAHSSSAQPSRFYLHLISTHPTISIWTKPQITPNACEMHCRSFHDRQHIWARNLSLRKIRKAKNQIYLFTRNNFSDQFFAVIFFRQHTVFSTEVYQADPPYFQPKCIKLIHHITKRFIF